MAKANFGFGIFMVIISLLVLVTARSFPTSESANGYGPDFFPVIIAYIIMGLCLLLFIETVRKKEKRTANIQIKSLIMPITLVILIIIYAFIFKHLGYFITTISILFLSMVLLKTKPLKSFIISLAVTIVIYVGFKLVLNVPLPTGIFI